jgi:hypothetical protein
MCELCAFVGYDTHGDGFPVNSTTVGDQTLPNIARLADGRFIVVYRSGDTPGNGTDIRARIFNSNGTAAGSDFLVNQTTAGDQTGPALFQNSNGTLSFVWQTPDLAVPGNTQLVERSFDLTGNPLGGEHQVSASGSDGSYTFMQRQNGTIFVVYENDGDIYGRTLDANWTNPTAEVRLNSTTDGTQIGARLVALANGNILIAFQSNDGGDGGGTVIRNRVFSATGDTWTAVSVNGTTNDFVVDTTGTGDQTSVRVARFHDGRVLEVWQSGDGGDGSGTAIRARIISATGDPAAAAGDFIVDTTTAGNQLRPSILAFDDGRKLIYWHSFETGTDTIHGRFVHANGALDASDFVIASLPDTSVPAFGLFLLANQQVGFTYQGVSSGDGLGAGIQAAIRSAANLSLSDPFTNPGTSPFDLALQSFTVDQAAQQISRANAPWNGELGSSHSLTYSFRATSTGVSYNNNGASGFTQFNAAQIAVAEAAIQLWEDVSGITLTRVQDAGSEYSDSGQLLLWNYASATPGSQAANASGFGGWSNSGGEWHHTVALFDDRANVTAPTFDNSGFRLFLHEIGHALGLLHPGNYNALPGGASVPYDGNAIYREDTGQYSVMSYFDEAITHANFVDTSAMTPLLHDIAAMQRLYGRNYTTRTGDTTYGFNSNAGRDSYAITSASQHVVFAVWDGGGNDTLDFSGYDTPQVISLAPGQFSSVGGLEFNVVVAPYTVIENAIGGMGADVITGNSSDNRLSGGAGGDTLTGSFGTDTFVFGATALTDAQAAVPVIDRITDFNQESGIYIGYDRLDLSALIAASYNHGSGQPVGSLVRAVTNGTGASLQVDTDGAIGGASWTTIAQLDGVPVGKHVGIVLDATLPDSSVRVTSIPDLDVLNTMTLSSQSMVAFGSTTATFMLANSGFAAAGASKVGFYRSSDSTFDASDTLLTERSFSQLNARAEVDDNYTFKLSTLGTYYIIAVADYDDQIPGEGSESNNASNAVQVTVTDSETINNADGSYTVHRADALDQYSFTDYFINYDNQGHATSQTTNNDDGSRIVFAWDVQSQSDWADYHLTYDDQDRVVSQVTHNDDTSYIVFAWDVASQNDWADYRVTYNSQDRPITQVTNNDDGSRIVFKWDVASQNDWADYRVTYDGQDRPVTQVTNNDDGSQIVFKWDVANQFTWSDYRVTTDSLGRAVSQVTNNDDGTHQTYGWDVQSQATWSDYVVTTDSQNRATEQTTHYDDGTFTVMTWDVENQFNWASTTDYYDAQGQHVQQRGVYDDGTTWLT